MVQDPEIHALLRQLTRGDEFVRRDTLAHMQDYRAFAFARPKQAHVDVIKALLKTRLTELLSAAKREGKV